jgi:hypothetical protein
MQDRHSSRADSFFPGYTLFSVGGMAQGGEWSETVTPRGQTHSLQAAPCLVSEEWPRVGSSPGLAIRDSYSSRVDSFSPGYTLFSVGRMAQGGE